MSDESNEQIPVGGLIYVDVLIVTAICGGLINLFLFIRFLKYRHEIFLSSRYPQLIIVYCLISLITSIIVLPLVFHYEIKEQRDYGYYMEIISEFFEEALFMILLSIIVGRSYLLYFDYNFAQATVDQNWRGKIVSNEQNFWLKYRNSYGNIRFVIHFLFAINGIFLIGLICVTVVIVSEHNISLFHYFTIFGVSPFYTICIVYLLYKIRRSINDTFFIKKEITFLSTFVVFRIIALLIDIIIAGATHHHGASLLVFYTVEVLTQFTSVWIQSCWVLNKLKYQNDEEFTPSEKIIKENVKMIDILTYKFGFESLVRHCVNELSVENVLFCVEIAQFRYYFQQNSLSGKLKFENNLINVNTHDFVECINYHSDDEKQPQFKCMINGISTSNMKRFQEAMMSNKYVPIASQLLSSPISASCASTQSCMNVDINGGRVRTLSQSEVEPAADLYSKSIYEYVVHLYTKYIKNSADLCINIPGDIRSDLTKVFISGNKENVYKYIESLQENSKEDKIFVETYLYHIFDAAFADIWNLLNIDSFVRFRRTAEYAKVAKKIVADKSV
eukprot:455108_1